MKAEVFISLQLLTRYKATSERIFWCSYLVAVSNMVLLPEDSSASLFLDIFFWCISYF